MKKTLISLILCGLLALCPLYFAACGKKDFKVKDFRSEYLLVLADYKDEIDTTGGKIKFKYSEGEFFEEAVTSVKPYSYLTTFYNPLLDNAMSFVYYYVEQNPVVKQKVDTKLSNRLNSQLATFDSSLKDVCDMMDSFKTSVEFSFPTRKTSTSCLTRYRSLLDSYNKLYEASLNMSGTLYQIYIRYINTGLHYNYYAQTSFDANHLVSRLSGKIDWQCVNLTRRFIEENVRGTTLIDDITNADNNYTMDTTAYNDYLTKQITPLLNANINTEAGADGKTVGDKINETKKDEFKELAIELYNCETLLNNDFDIYMEACHSISFATVDAAAEKSEQETVYLNIIKAYNQKIEDYSDILEKTITLIKEF